MSLVMPYVSPITPQIATVMSRLGDIALPQIMADLSAVPPYVANVLPAIAPVAAELVPVTPGGLGLSGTQCGSADDQRQQGEENGAASHTSFLLKSGIRRAETPRVRKTAQGTAVA